MAQEIMCFSNNHDIVKAVFKDYMGHYMTEAEGRTGYVYSKELDFSAKEEKINKLMKEEIFSLAKVDMDASTLVSKEMWATHPLLHWASFAVANAFIDMIIPDTIDKSIGMYTESRFVSLGDSQSFNVESNDLFFVSKAGRDQRTVEFQRQYEGQVTVIPENREISVQVNLYRVLCGLDSLAKFVSKAILSIESQITKEVYQALDAAMMALPTTPVDGNLRVTGYSQNSAVALAQRVTAFNNGAKAVYLGTQLALQNVLPSDANYRYSLDSDFVKLGYVKTAFGTDVMVMPQVANWKTPYELVLNDDRIYVVSPSSQKIVKLVYEGSTFTNTMAAQTTANLTETTTINKSWGIAVATNATAGVITLS